MRKLKIMSEDVPMASGDVFGVNVLQDRLKAFCREQGLEAPRFWVFPPDGCYVCHAVSLHLTSKDKQFEYDARVIFELKDFSGMENRDAEANRLRCMFKDLGEPIILTSKVAGNPNNQHRFFKNVGLIKMPVTWSDNHQEEYEVYVKGQLVMDEFASLMERVEYIGKEIVYR
jgi:hypothetical protein